MARQDAMATIDAALLAAQQAPAPGAPSPDVQPHLALDVPELSAGQVRFLEQKRKDEEAAGKQKAALTKEQEAILKAQEKLLGEEEAARLREEQEALNARSALRKSAEQAVRNSQQIVKQVDTRIGSIPQPGSIVLPLVILLFLFFILIQIGGYSRLAWFWAVITHNAQVMTVQQQFVGPGGGEIGPGQSGDTGLPPLSITPLSRNGVYGGPY